MDLTQHDMRWHALAAVDIVKRRQTRLSATRAFHGLPRIR